MSKGNKPKEKSSDLDELIYNPKNHTVSNEAFKDLKDFKPSDVIKAFFNKGKTSEKLTDMQYKILTTLKEMGVDVNNYSGATYDKKKGAFTLIPRAADGSSNINKKVKERYTKSKELLEAEKQSDYNKLQQLNKDSSTYKKALSSFEEKYGKNAVSELQGKEDNEQKEQELKNYQIKHYNETKDIWVNNTLKNPRVKEKIEELTKNSNYIKAVSNIKQELKDKFDEFVKNGKIPYEKPTKLPAGYNVKFDARNLKSGQYGEWKKTLEKLLNLANNGSIEKIDYTDYIKSSDNNAEEDLVETIKAIRNKQDMKNAIYNLMSKHPNMFGHALYPFKGEEDITPKNKNNNGIDLLSKFKKNKQ